MLIRGGRVLDPAAVIDGILDVAIRQGRVAAVDGGIPPESAYRVVDAGGALVTPGLIDLHTHIFCGFTYWGLPVDSIAARTGVTTWVDAGSAGAITLSAFREHVVKPADVRVRAFLNIAYTGLVGPDFELQIPELCDVDLFERMFHLNHDLLVGLKVRMGSPTVGTQGLDPMRAARTAADRCDTRIMLHIADAPPAIDEVLPSLRAGDVITHCASGATMKLVDDDGALRESTRRALAAGVVLDVGHGAGGMTFASSEALIAAGHPPDVISTDLHQMSVHGRSVASNDAAASPFITIRDDGASPLDLPTCMAKYLALGLSLEQVVAATTARPAELIGEAGRLGTLAPGAAADVAIFALDRTPVAFADTRGETRAGTLRLRNLHTFVAGREIERSAARAPAPWVDLIAPEAA